MPRPLAPDERAVWSRVAATVRPLGGRAARPAPVADLKVRPTEAVPPKTSRAVLATPVAAATLDGSWDRRARQGRVETERTLDLHGMTASQAHGALTSAVQDASVQGVRALLVVTGRSPGGVLRQSLAHWLDAPTLRPYIAALRPAHARHGGAGAWYVVLRRRR